MSNSPSKTLISSTAFSSLESLDHPLVLSQGYLLPITSVSAMSVTNTERGITHKNLLMAIENGYLYSVPKNMLDPRRGFQQTAELAEEGLMPYLPELPLHPIAFINYNMTGKRNNMIYVASSLFYLFVFFIFHSNPSSPELQKIFSFLGNGGNIVCEMKVVFTIANIQYICSFIC